MGKGECRGVNAESNPEPNCTPCERSEDGCDKQARGLWWTATNQISDQRCSVVLPRSLKRAATQTFHVTGVYTALSTGQWIFYVLPENERMLAITAGSCVCLFTKPSKVFTTETWNLSTVIVPVVNMVELSLLCHISCWNHSVRSSLLWFHPLFLAVPHIPCLLHMIITFIYWQCVPIKKKLVEI